MATRDLREMLTDASAELASAVTRWKAGETSAYVSAAAQLRKIVGTGRGNDLLERALGPATLHRLKSPPGDVLDRARQTVYVDDLVVANGNAVYSLPWLTQLTPIPMNPWRRQVLFVSRGLVTIGQFVQAFGNQEGSHADESFHEALSRLDNSRIIQVGERSLRFGPPLAIALADYVSQETRQMLADIDV